ncbi:hypothetical protein WEI85_16070 [Actinomycetes bacterium KLBMP 9797]
MWWVVGAVAVAALLSAYLLWTASRVERLHQRAAAAAKGLDAHLLRRAAAAAVLAEACGAMELYAAARIALDAGPGEREAAENDLTRQLRALPDGLVEDLAPASRRLAVARQVHTDLVRDALAARRRPVVRLFRMTRKHPAPAYFDIDDPIVTPVEIPTQASPVETPTP